MDKIRINDLSKLDSLKELIYGQISEMAEDFTPEEIIKSFEEHFKSQKEKDNFKKIIISIPPDIFDKIYKRLRFQIKKSLSYLRTVVEEEKGSKDSGIEIKKESKDEALEKKIEEKKEGLKQMIKKVTQVEAEVEAIYEEKICEFFKKNSMPPEYRPTLKIRKHNPQEIVVNAEQVIDLFIVKKEEQGNKLIQAMTETFDQTKEIKQELYDDYKFLEEELHNQREMVAIFTNAQNEKEKHLIDNNILF